MLFPSFRKITCIFFVYCFAYSLYAEQADSLFVNKLTEVQVTENIAAKNLRSGMPVQSIDKDELKTMNVLQLSDAVKHFSGVVVKDFGGVGGMKTVSVRGMGAAHTAMSYDGMLVSDAQSGMVDIGRFSLDNVSLITLNNGQSEDIFQPARMLSSASVLNVLHVAPLFNENQIVSGGAELKVGSFNFWNPSLYINNKWNNIFSSSLSGEYMQTDGDYPFTSDFEHHGTYSDYKRKNTDVQSFRIEPAVYADFQNKGNMYLKAYYYQSERGLPGAIIVNAPNASHQRLWDKNLFVQTQYKNDFSQKLSFQFNGKYTWTYQYYFDPDRADPNHSDTLVAKKGNTYYQQEYYASAAVLYKLLPTLNISLSTDGFINQMDTDTAGFICPTRYSWLTSLAAKYVTDRISITGSLLATVVKNEVKIGTAGDDYQKITPAISFSVKPFEEEFRIRAFYKEIFRMPTFNDLYYTQVGNRNVKPEYTTQYDIGITWSKSFSGWFSGFNLSVDGYYNKVKDKIVAIPIGNLFYWSIVNKGLVDIKGLDVTASANLNFCEKLKVDLSGNYTYQKVLDKTKTSYESKLYNNQLPYTPNHSGAASVSFNFPWFVFGYNILFSGERYWGDQNAKENLMPGYADQNLSVKKDVNLYKTNISLLAEILNVGNMQYSVVNGYPMQGRSYRVTISAKF